jgi:exodeoxyribonuclease V alpha subunit
LRVETRIIKKVFEKDGFCIFGCVPTKEYPGLKLNPTYQNFTITGNLPFLNEGEVYTLDIEEAATTKYGTQYKVLSVPKQDAMEITDDNEFTLLLQVTSRQIAYDINKAYPNFIRLILAGKDDEIDLKKIYNVKSARFESIKRQINEKHKYFQILTELHEYEISMSDCQTLAETYQSVEGAVEAVRNNPYEVLIELLGRGFMRVDKLILSIHPELRLSDQRVEFIILHILAQNELTGNSKMVARDMAVESVNIDKEVLKLLKDVAIKSDRIYYDERSNDMAMMATYLAECQIADFVKSKVNQDMPLDLNWQDYKQIGELALTDEQMGLLENFCKHTFSMLIGSAGSGKSQTTKALINLLEDNDMSYELLCPTGKAAKKLAQYTERPTSTIHRKCYQTEKQIWADVIVVDEFSMVDISVFKMLIESIQNPNCRIVLVFDDAQLNSISAGNVCFDLMHSNLIPTTKLEKIFRYDSDGSLFVATNIRKGIKYLNSDPIQKFGENFTFMQSSDCFQDLISAYISLVQRGISPSDILCLTPYNVGSEGTYNINNHIQSIVNPPLPNEKNMTYKRSNAEITFRKGSRVLNKKNTYNAMTLAGWDMEQKAIDEDLDYDSNEFKTTVFNGDDGVVVDVDDEKLVVDFDGEKVVFTRDNIKNLVLAWSCSVHSSQGSQAPYVINITSPTHSRMLSRNLIYVACTRSSGKHIEIGDIKTINDALKIAGQYERNTFLKNILTND